MALHVARPLQGRQSSVTDQGRLAGTEAEHLHHEYLPATSFLNHPHVRQAAPWRALHCILHCHAGVCSAAQAYVEEATFMAAAEGGVLAAASSLVQQPSGIWRKGSMLVSLLGESVMVCEGIPEGSLRSGASARAEPPLGMPGQLIALEVQRLPDVADPCRVLCRSRGSYWAVQVNTAANALAVAP